MRWWLLAGVGLAAAHGAQAQTVDEVVVTASRLPALAGDTTVRTLPIAGQTPGASLGQVLSGQPDIFVLQPGGRAGVGSIYLRGADPNFTVVMLDGIPLNDATDSRGGAVDASALGIGDLERIEIAPGVRSAVHGSGALAGVINLILPAGTQPGGRIEAGVGSEGDGLVLGAWRGPVGGYAGGLSAQWEDGGEPTPGSSFEGGSLSGKLAAADAGQAGLRSAVFRLSHTQSEGFPDDSGGDRLAVIRTPERREADQGVGGVRFGWALGGGSDLEVLASVFRREEDIDSPGVAPGLRDPFGLPASQSSTRFTRSRLQAVLRAEPAANWRLALGAEAQRETGDSRGTLTFFGFPLPTSFDLERDTVSAFAEAGYRNGGWSLDLAARADRPEGFDTRATGGLALAWAAPDGGFTARAAVGSGFKAPSFYALANPLVGNPALRPETSQGIDLALAWRLPGGGRFEADGFYSRYRDLIDFLPTPFPHLENVAAVVSRGVTLTGETPLGETLTVRGRLAYIETYDRGTGAQLRGRPRWRGGADLDWRVAPSLTAGLTLDYVGERLESSIPTADIELDGYATLAARLTWKPRDDLALTASVENLTDTDYQTGAGFSGPGTTARLTLRRTFGG
ncbi:outer membrane cobalamin receptor [Caulobacter ginsengisoli]|uniref:Outer membrane cobalamin receptor n=1 Tax=Caulobacter ginsengisoli TaxID=400775 RepID=A0ABU0ILH1_9CAUL|nr:TonB-dependent receptor [Caulobacter ginsengisoli]MDQ0462863.1 outer membrane cobalamin receptor [Caulobacter ginsengisoli]